MQSCGQCDKQNDVTNDVSHDEINKISFLSFCNI